MLKSGGFGKPVLDINQKGSRVASYTATPEKDSPREKVQSICCMNAYKDKCPEELRFEDYQLGDKGQASASIFGVSSTCVFGVNDNSRTLKPLTFKQLTANQPVSNGKFSRTTSTLFPKSEQSTSTTSSVAPAFTTPAVSFSPWINAQPFGPLNPASGSSTTSAFSPSTNPWAMSTSSSSALAQSTNSWTMSTSSAFSPSTDPRAMSTSSAFSPSADPRTMSTSSAFSPSTNTWAMSTSSAFSPSMDPRVMSTSSAFSPSTNTWAMSTSSAFSPSTDPRIMTTSFAFSPSTNPSAISSSTLTQSYPWAISPISSSQPGFVQNKTSLSPNNLPILPTPTPSNFINNSLPSWPLKPTFSSLASTGAGNPPTLGPTQNTASSGPMQPGTTSCSGNGNGQGVGHLSVNAHLSYSPNTAASVMLASKTQPAVQVSIKHPGSATSVQYGISSLPVTDKSAPVSRRSSLIIRHSSLSSRNRLPPQKYNPASDKPKVPFFMDKEDASDIVREGSVITPRDNLRDWVRSTTKQFPLRSDSNGLSQRTSMDYMHDEQGVGDNCGELYSVPEDMHNNDSSSKGDVNTIMPKLERGDYYTVPSIEELMSKEKEEAGFCSHVKNFVVGRHGYGSIKLLGETDVRNLDLDSAVYFSSREVIVYMDESKKPPVGQGLNKPAEITLLNFKCINKSSGKEYEDGPMVDKYRDMLSRKAAEQGAEFVSYDPVKVEWKFRISHF